MPIWTLIIIGIAAGFVATKVMKLETNFIITAVIGILGALIGGTVMRMLVTVMGFAAGFLGAVLGAMFLIWLWRKYGEKR